jgi:ferredoxin
MGFTRMSMIYLLIASVLMAPFAVAQESCGGDAPASASADAASAHADHGMMSAMVESDAAPSAGDAKDASCCDDCEACFTACPVSGFAAEVVAAFQAETDYLAGSRSFRDLIFHPPNPPPPFLFRPPIRLA